MTPALVFSSIKSLSFSCISSSSFLCLPLLARRSLTASSDMSFFNHCLIVSWLATPISRAVLRNDFSFFSSLAFLNFSRALSIVSLEYIRLLCHLLCRVVASLRFVLSCVFSSVSGRVGRPSGPRGRRRSVCDGRRVVRRRRNAE